MFIEHDFYVGLRDINTSKELSNTALLSYLEDVACMHSEIAGFGVNNMDEVKRTWILLSWKIKVIKRPKFNDTIKVRTWSRLIDKFYAFRDFEIYNQNKEIIGIATSKWIFIDTEKGKIVKVTDEVSKKYEQEDKSVFEQIDLEKLEAPNNFIKKEDYKITKNMIDVNNHLHNIYYLDVAKEVLADDIKEPSEFEVMYKHEVKLGETVKSIYSKEKDYHYLNIKNENETDIHAIIRLR